MATEKRLEIKRLKAIRNVFNVTFVCYTCRAVTCANIILFISVAQEQMLPFSSKKFSFIRDPVSVTAFTVLITQHIFRKTLRPSNILLAAASEMGNNKFSNRALLHVVATARKPIAHRVPL